MTEQLKKIVLSPTQDVALRGLIDAFDMAAVVRLLGATGRGKSTVLEELHARTGGKLISLKELLDSKHHPFGLEEAFYDLVLAALQAHALVLVDDVGLLHQVLCACHFYPRQNFFEAALLALSVQASKTGKKLVFTGYDHLPSSLESRSLAVGFRNFQAEDYRALAQQWLDASQVRLLDFEEIFRFAPKLNGHQLKAACVWAKKNEQLTTKSFIEYLKSQRLASNVDLGEVQAVDLRSLQGVDDVIRSLEINIVLPLENDSIASELNLRPKRGVLLYGPPGTGKTTVGRALAHRLKGKFFLIDGTFIAGSSGFYYQIQQVFEGAKDNAPAVIFIDDADAIFEQGEEQAFYRYLLTMIDGLESESASRICVMLTAMNVSNLPPALVRSGRVELWLEMKLPDAGARRRIIEQHLSQMPEQLRSVRYDEIVQAAEDFTGADLKRMVEDGKALYAFDRVAGTPLRSPTDYMLEAISNVRSNKVRYSQAEEAAQLNRMRQGMSGIFSQATGFIQSFGVGRDET